jgi:hypothetical protein
MKNSLVAMTDKILTSFLSHRSEVELCWDFSIQMFIDKITKQYDPLPHDITKRKARKMPAQEQHTEFANLQNQNYIHSRKYNA